MGSLVPELVLVPKPNTPSRLSLCYDSPSTSPLPFPPPLPPSPSPLPFPPPLPPSPSPLPFPLPFPPPLPPSPSPLPFPPPLPPSPSPSPSPPPSSRCWAYSLLAIVPGIRTQIEWGTTLELYPEWHVTAMLIAWG